MTLAGFDDDGTDRMLRTVEHRPALKRLRKVVIDVAMVDAGRDVLGGRLKIGGGLQPLFRRNGCSKQANERSANSCGVT